MNKIKFVHTADLHLDTPFKGISNLQPDLSKRLREATFKSFANIIDLCIQQKVDFLLIAGDIFDNVIRSLAAQLRFVKELSRLSNQGIHTYFICGNHDPLNSWLDSHNFPENVHRLGATEVVTITYEKANRPLVDIYGISYLDKAINENLAINYNLKSNSAPISIALLHGTIGSAGPHENYAPFKLEDVINKNFDYWALGHIHKRQLIHESRPTILYPGNPQGRDFGETGTKGCYLVQINAGNTPQIEFIPRQLIRFEEVEVDVSEENKIDRLADRIEESKRSIDDHDENASYLLRITLRGRTPLHSRLSEPGEIEQLLNNFNEGKLNQLNFTWIDQIKLNTQPDIDVEQLKKRADFPAEVVKKFAEYEGNSEQLQKLIQNFDQDFVSNLAKRELRELSELDREEILESAKWILIDRLVREEA